MNLLDVAGDAAKKTLVPLVLPPIPPLRGLGTSLRSLSLGTLRWLIVLAVIAYAADLQWDYVEWPTLFVSLSNTRLDAAIAAVLLLVACFFSALMTFHHQGAELHALKIDQMPRVAVEYDPQSPACVEDVPWDASAPRVGLKSQLRRVRVRSLGTVGVTNLRVVLADIQPGGGSDLPLRERHMPPTSGHTHECSLTPGDSLYFDVVLISHSPTEEFPDHIRWQYADRTAPNHQRGGSYHITIRATGDNVPPATSTFVVKLDDSGTLHFAASQLATHAIRAVPS